MKRSIYKNGVFYFGNSSVLMDSSKVLGGNYRYTCAYYNKDGSLSWSKSCCISRVISDVKYEACVNAAIDAILDMEKVPSVHNEMTVFHQQLVVQSMNAAIAADRPKHGCRIILQMVPVDNIDHDCISYFVEEDKLYRYKMFTNEILKKQRELCKSECEMNLEDFLVKCCVEGSGVKDRRVMQELDALRDYCNENLTLEYQQLSELYQVINLENYKFRN